MRISRRQFARILFLAAVLLALVSSLSRGAAATKVLHFPADQYMGHLSIEDSCLGSEYYEGGRDLSFPFGLDPKRVCLAGDWDILGPAQGDVLVPTDRKLQLAVTLRLRTKDAAKIAALPPRQYAILGTDRCRPDPDDLKGLSQLGSDDLHTLRVCSLVRTADADRRVLEPIAGLTGLQVLGLYKTGITGKGMERLKDLSGLRALELNEERISVRDLAVLKDLPALEYFDMYPGTTDAGLKHVAQAKSLRWLRLRMGRIWGPGLAELAKLPHLERLSLWGTTGLTDRHIHQLEGLTHLKSLTLWGTDAPLTDASLASIAKLEHLEELHFIRINTRFTDAGMRHLERLRNLRKASFTFLQIGAEGVQHLANLPRLESLKGLAPTADAAAVLPSFRNLKSLDVNWVIPPIGTPVPPEVVTAMGQLHSLEELAVMGGQWSQEDLLVFGNLSNLKRLRLGMNDDFGDPVLAELARLKNLEYFTLRGTVSKRGLNQLNSLTKLRTLEVRPMSKGGSGIDETPLNLPALRGLKTLSLQRLSLQDADLASLAGLQDLEVFYVNGAFTEAGLRHLHDLPSLKYLHIRGISCPTGRELAHLADLTKLADLKLRGRIPDAALGHLPPLAGLWSLTVETDEPIHPGTVRLLREGLPQIEYIHITEPMRFDTPPIPIRGTRDRTPPKRQRRRR